jgi:hypothetical protein
MKLHARCSWCAVILGVALPLDLAAAQAPAQPTSPTTEAPTTPKSGSQPPLAARPVETPASQNLIGLNVFSADGTRVGEVRSVSTGPAGDVIALHIRTGGFLGFGGRIVAIPGGKFIRSGQSIRLDLDSDEVAGLPEVKD